MLASRYPDSADHRLVPNAFRSKDRDERRLPADSGATVPDSHRLPAPANTPPIRAETTASWESGDVLKETLLVATYGVVMASDSARDTVTRLERLMRVRRDVRHFTIAPVPHELVDEAVRLATLAPSVGYSQPWRWVLVEDAGRRRAVIEAYEAANARARAAIPAERREEYGRLKLSGLREAPVHLAVFCDVATSTGGGLGRHTMPQTLQYSVAMAIHAFWLAARALGLGVGWVSILDSAAVVRALDVPPAWELIGYLAVGYPEFSSTTPELVDRGWECPDGDAARILRR
jgi:5,6-dimethylbenzimidazole synthase